MRNLRVGKDQIQKARSDFEELWSVVVLDLEVHLFFAESLTDSADKLLRFGQPAVLADHEHLQTFVDVMAAGRGTDPIADGHSVASHSAESHPERRFRRVLCGSA